MGRYVNGLLGQPSGAVEAMQNNPRPNYRDMIDRPMAGQEEALPNDLAPRQDSGPAQQSPPPETATPPSPSRGPVLSGEPTDYEDADNSTGAAFMPPSAEDEKQARIFMANVVDFIYGDGLDSISRSLKTQGQPVNKTVGEITAELVGVQLDSAEVGGKPISQDIWMALGAEVVNQLYELAYALGVWAPQGDQQAQQEMSTSLNYAVNLFVEQQAKIGRKDRLQGLVQAGEAVKRGDYDSPPGSAIPQRMAPQQQPQGEM